MLPRCGRQILVFCLLPSYLCQDPVISAIDLRFGTHALSASERADCLSAVRPHLFALIQHILAMLGTKGRCSVVLLRLRQYRIPQRLSCRKYEHFLCCALQELLICFVLFALLFCVSLVDLNQLCSRSCLILVFGRCANHEHVSGRVSQSASSIHLHHR